MTNLAHVHSEIEKTAINRAIDEALSVVPAKKPLRLSQWMAKYFYLSKESSYTEGKWEAYPFQPAIADCMANDDIEEVDVVKAARLGFTKILLGLLFYNKHHRSRNDGMYRPTDRKAKKFSTTDFDPAVRDMPEMQKVFPDFKSRNKNNVVDQKTFLSGILNFLGGTAAQNYRDYTFDTVVQDEADSFDLDIEGEGDSFSLSNKRLEGSAFPKHIVGSTPKSKEFSLVWNRAKLTPHQFKFNVRCPHCGEFHPIEWGGNNKPHGFKWDHGKPETVQYLCLHCSALYTQADFYRVWKRGRYIDPQGNWIGRGGLFYDKDNRRIPTPKHVAFFIWSAISPQTTWVAIVEEFLAASEAAKRGDKSKLKTFVNTTLGEPWEEQYEKGDAAELMKAAKDFPLKTVRMGGLQLTAGVDVQDNRFEVSVYAYGRNNHMQVVDHEIMFVNPGLEKDWEKLDEYLLTKFPHESGTMMEVDAVGIDTGGHFTHEVYNWVRRQPAWREIHALKGSPDLGKPVIIRSSLVDVNWNGRILKGGLKLWHVCVNTAKDLFYNRINTPGVVHFSNQLPREFYDQLVAESRVPQRVSNGIVHRWVCPANVRNEPWDCGIYSIFSAFKLGIPNYTNNKWDQLENKVQPPTADMFAQEQVEKVAAIPAAAQQQSNDTGGIGSDAWGSRL